MTKFKVTLLFQTLDGRKERIEATTLDTLDQASSHIALHKNRDVFLEHDDGSFVAHRLHAHRTDTVEA